MYDLISRRVAIDKIRAERNKSSTPKEWHDGMNMAIFYLTHLQPLKELSKWKADFKEYINALNMPKDDYDGIMEYIDEVPSAEQEAPDINVGNMDTTTHDSIPAKTGGNDEDRTSGDCISRQQAIDALKEKVFRNLTDEFYGAMQVLDELPSVKPETNCSEIPNNSDTISRQAAIDALKTDMASLDHIIKGMSAYDVRLDAYVSQRNQVNFDIDTISNLPPVQPEQRRIPITEESVIQAGYEGKEVRFRLRGRLFAIRELAQ